MEVVDEGYNAGKVVVIKVRGSGAPLRRNIWMRLEKERKTPDFGTGEFVPDAKDDHVVLGEHKNCVFFK